MPRYIVHRTLEHPLPIDGPLAELCQLIVERNGDDATWLHSYVSEDGRRWLCAYEARSPEAIRTASARSALPVDSITAVRVLDPYLYRDPRSIT
jgi:hypothetical protein